MAPALRPPSILFEQPLCAEVMGAGFQKVLGSKVSYLAVESSSC